MASDQSLVSRVGVFSPPTQWNEVSEGLSPHFLYNHSFAKENSVFI